MSTPQSFATLYSDLIKTARLQIQARKAVGTGFVNDPFWSDDEFFSYAKSGTADLYKAIIDLHHEHFLTVNTTDVSLPAGLSATTGLAQLAGVPADTFRVYLIESQNPTINGLKFVPRAANHRDFISARWFGANSAVTPTLGQVIFYCLVGAGAPTGAPTVLVAPQIQTTVPLNFWYIPALDTRKYVIDNATNPIPGESDQAIIDWMIAYALGKEGEAGNRVPDAAWMTLYATEKQNLLASLTPRQEQEAEYVDSVFGDL